MHSPSRAGQGFCPAVLYALPFNTRLDGDTDILSRHRYLLVTEVFLFEDAAVATIYCSLRGFIEEEIATGDTRHYTV